MLASGISYTCNRGGGSVDVSFDLLMVGEGPAMSLHDPSPMIEGFHKDICKHFMYLAMISHNVDISVSRH